MPQSRSGFLFFFVITVSAAIIHASQHFDSDNDDMPLQGYPYHLRSTGNEHWMDVPLKDDKEYAYFSRFVEFPKPYNPTRLNPIGFTPIQKLIYNNRDSLDLVFDKNPCPESSSVLARNTLIPLAQRLNSIAPSFALKDIVSSYFTSCISSKDPKNAAWIDVWHWHILRILYSTERHPWPSQSRMDILSEFINVYNARINPKYTLQPFSPIKRIWLQVLLDDPVFYSLWVGRLEPIRIQINEANKDNDVKIIYDILERLVEYLKESKRQHAQVLKQLRTEKSRMQENVPRLSALNKVRKLASSPTSEELALAIPNSPRFTQDKQDKQETDLSLLTSALISPQSIRKSKRHRKDQMSNSHTGLLPIQSSRVTRMDEQGFVMPSSAINSFNRNNPDVVDIRLE